VNGEKWNNQECSTSCGEPTALESCGDDTLNAPRLIAPLSGKYVRDRRPEIIWDGASSGVSQYRVEIARDSGLLDVPVIAGHCIWVGRPDIGILAAHGVAAAHNPVANMILASGVCPVDSLRSAGIAVGLGTDGAASNDSQNMLEAMKTAALLQKVSRLDPRALTAPDVLAMATIDGARGLGLSAVVGSLETGKRADVVRFHGHGPGLANIHDPYQQLVYCTSPLDVADVWVDGRPRVRDGRLVGADLGSLIDDSRPLAAELVTRAGMQDLSCLARSS